MCVQLGHGSLALGWNCNEQNLRVTYHDCSVHYLGSRNSAREQFGIMGVVMAFMKRRVDGWILEPEYETMNRKKLEKLQEDRLRKIVRYCYEQISLYKRKFREAGITPDVVRNLEDLRKIPVTRARASYAVAKEPSVFHVDRSK